MLRQVVEFYPLEGKALFLLGQHAWEENDHARASLFFERAAKEKEWQVRALIEHARMQVSVRKYDEAIRLLQEVQAIDPQPRIDRYLQSIQNLVLSSRIQP